MKDLIKSEYRKLWNGVSIVSLVALSILTVIYAVVTLNIQHRTIDSDGNIVTGLASFRTLKDAAEDIEGIMDGEYIQTLIKKYDSSFDKAYMDEHRGFLGTGGMTKYIISNYVINYAYFGPYMSNGNDKIGLDYDFLNTENDFYQKYKEAVMEQLLYVNEENGLSHYSEKQIKALEKKIGKMRIPFRVAYHTGWANIRNYFENEYSVFFILLVFCLSSVYAKDSTNGMDEPVLASKHGRKKDMTARWIAGNLFALTAYLIYVGVLIAVHGSIEGLHGLSASAQTFWFECFYNISVGGGLLLIFLGGLAGALVMADITMFLSVKIKNSKIVVAAGIVIVKLLEKAASTYSRIRLLNPKQFGGNEAAVDFLFVGRVIIPYFVVILFLSIIYITALWMITRLSFKKY